MPYKEKIIEKRYFSIKEVSQQLGISPPLLRFWEKELNLDTPLKKGTGKTRRYLSKQIEELQKIKKLLREDKYSLQGVKNLLKKRKSNPLPDDLIDSMKEAKQFFESLRDQIS